MSQSFIIVEDHRLFAQALMGLIVQVDKFESKGIITDGEKVFDLLMADPPDLLFLDLVMPNFNGVDLIVRLREAKSPIKIIVISMLKDNLVIFKAMDAGAQGFIPKNTDFEELELAIKTIVSGETYLSESVKSDIERLNAHHNSDWEERNLEAKVNVLSAREKEIVQLIAHGYTNIEIGEKLFLSSLTVKTHRHNILKKLGLKNSAALVKYATELGLI